jgi:hypothetical protein
MGCDILTLGAPDVKSEQEMIIKRSRNQILESIHYIAEQCPLPFLKGTPKIISPPGPAKRALLISHVPGYAYSRHTILSAAAEVSGRTFNFTCE